MTKPNLNFSRLPRNSSRMVLGLALAVALSSALAQSSPSQKPSVAGDAPAIQAEPTVQAPVATQVVPATPVSAVPSVDLPAPDLSPSPVDVVDPVSELQQTVQQENATRSPPVMAGQTPPATMGTNSAQLVTPYAVPPSGPGIFQGSSQTFREISYLQAEKDLIEARTARENALKTQAEAHAALNDVLSGNEPGKDGDRDGAGNQENDPQAKEALRQAELRAQALKIARTPYVNSVYMYGDKAYAEIVVGSTWTMAHKGTVLTSGDRVVDISPTGVVVTGKQGRRTIPVRGSAAIE